MMNWQRLRLCLLLWRRIRSRFFCPLTRLCTCMIKPVALPTLWRSPLSVSLVSLSISVFTSLYVCVCVCTSACWSVGEAKQAAAALMLGLDTPRRRHPCDVMRCLSRRRLDCPSASLWCIMRHRGRCPPPRCAPPSKGRIASRPGLACGLGLPVCLALGRKGFVSWRKGSANRPANLASRASSSLILHVFSGGGGGSGGGPRGLGPEGVALIRFLAETEAGAHGQVHSSRTAPDMGPMIHMNVRQGRQPHTSLHFCRKLRLRGGLALAQTDAAGQQGTVVLQRLLAEDPAATFTRARCSHTLGSPTLTTQPAQGRPYQKSLSSSKVPALSITSLLTHNHKHRAHAKRPTPSLRHSLSLSLSRSLNNTHAVGERAHSAGIEQQECAHVFRVRITCPPGYVMTLPLISKVRAGSSADALGGHRVREYPRFGRAGTLTAQTCSGTPRRRHPRPGPAGSGCC